MGDFIDMDLQDVPELELVPEGSQTLQCIDAEKTTSQSSGNPMLHVVLEQPGNELAEEIHEYMVFPVADDSKKTVIRKKRSIADCLEALGVPDFEQGFDTDSLIGKEAEVVIRHEEDPEHGPRAQLQDWIAGA